MTESNPHMLGITLWEPTAYLAGVLRGDAWLTSAFGLRVKDGDFAWTFAAAIERRYGRSLAPKRDERGYWLVRTSNKAGTFDDLHGFRPSTEGERRAWFRGLFDSEGNANCGRAGISSNSWDRRVAIYSTDFETIDMAADVLDQLGFPTRRRIVKPSATHIGTKPVHQLRISNSQEAFRRFADEIGSSIARKQAVLDQLPTTYQPPGHHARAGRKGMDARRARRDAGGVY